MSDIETLDNIKNLWPVPPSHRIDKSDLREKPPQEQQRKKKHKENKQDGPGKNIDEYA